MEQVGQPLHAGGGYARRRIASVTYCDASLAANMLMPNSQTVHIGHFSAVLARRCWGTTFEILMAATEASVRALRL
jgi:hypothetical protein